MDWHGAASSPISSLDYRARLQTIVSSKGTYTNICDELGAMGNTISSEVVVRKTPREPHFRITVKGDTKDAASTTPAEGTSAGYLIPSRGYLYPAEGLLSGLHQRGLSSGRGYLALLRQRVPHLGYLLPPAG